MNKERRKKITNISDRINEIEQSFDNLKAKAQEMIDAINEVLEEEQDYIDNMPENLADSDRAAAANEAVENIDEAIDLITEFCDFEFCAEDVTDKLIEACN